MAVQVFHGDERLAILFTNVVNRADVGMVEGRGGLRFTSETLQCLAVSGHVFREKLQGDKTVEASVLGFVHNTHPATAEPSTMR